MSHNGEVKTFIKKYQNIYKVKKLNVFRYSYFTTVGMTSNSSLGSSTPI